MKCKLQYTKQAIKYLRKSNRLTKSKCDELILQALKWIYLKEVSTVNLKKLAGSDSHYRVRYGDLRIVFSISETGEVLVALIELIAPRGDVYKKR